MESLGVDVGGVIIDSTNDGTDTSFFGDNYLNTTAVLDAFDVLRELVEGRFKDRVFIVSKCGPRVEKKTREWLAHHHFFERTGILREHVRFCRMRHHKAPLCHELGITHFVDDRLEVLGFMTTVPHRFLFRGRPHEVARFAEHLPNVLQVRTWQEIRERLL